MRGIEMGSKYIKRSRSREKRKKKEVEEEERKGGRQR